VSVFQLLRRHPFALLFVAVVAFAVARLLRPAPARPTVPAGTPDPFPFRPIARPSVAGDGQSRANGQAGAGWVEPDSSGACPLTHPVKVGASGIFHVPGGSSYERTKAARCYASPTAAEADGYRAAKR
jgi:micrococcal nuclease